MDENQARDAGAIIPERQAVNDAKIIVQSQQVILDKIERIRWLLQRIKGIGDSVKEVSEVVSGIDLTNLMAI